MADLAYAFHWSVPDMMDMDVVDLLQWHQQIDRINRLLNNR
jgi:hypothetical protein